MAEIVWTLLSDKVDFDSKDIDGKYKTLNISLVDQLSVLCALMLNGDSMHTWNFYLNEPRYCIKNMLKKSFTLSLDARVRCYTEINKSIPKEACV
jgi:hypothetical protein